MMLTTIERSTSICNNSEEILCDTELYTVYEHRGKRIYYQWKPILIYSLQNLSLGDVLLVSEYHFVHKDTFNHISQGMTLQIRI